MLILVCGPGNGWWSPRPGAFLALEEPGTWALVDLGFRPRPARRDPHRVRHRAPLLRRLRPAPGERSQPRPWPVRALPLQLGDVAPLALPGHRGHPRHAGPGACPCRAGQALVGNAQAVRMAAMAVGGSFPRAAQPRPGRRGRCVRDGHGDALHRLRQPDQLLLRAFLRRLGVHGRFRRARQREVRRHGACPAVATPADRTAHRSGRHSPRAFRRQPRGPGAGASTSPNRNSSTPS